MKLRILIVVAGTLLAALAAFSDGGPLPMCPPNKCKGQTYPQCHCSVNNVPEVR